MTYADDFNIRTTSVKFNDVADAIDGLLTRNYVSSTTGGPVNYIAAPYPVWSSYATASFLIIVPNVTNTAGSPSVTINVSGLGAKAIKRNNVDLSAGTLAAGIPTILVYTGTYFEVLLVDNALLRDGTNSMLADLNFGGFRPTNVAAGTAAAPAICPGNDADTGMWLPTANNLAFSTGGTERFRIDNLGEAGFGTSAPLTRLTVVGTGQNGAPSDSGDKLATIRVSSTAGGGNDGGQIEFGSGYGSYTQSYFSAIKGLQSNNTGNTLGHLAFYTRNGTSDTSLTERMRINGSGGAVGIGNSDPQYPLVIGSGVGQRVVSIFGGLSGTADGAALYITGTTATNHNAAFGHYSAILGGTADATPTLYTGGNLRFNSSTTIVGVLNGTGLSIGTAAGASHPLDIQAASNSVGLNVRARASDDVGTIRFATSADSEQGRIQFDTNYLRIEKEGNQPLLFHTNNAERMRIEGGGNVGIGTNNPGYQLELSLNSAAKPTSSSWTIVSDQRIKTNIQPYTKGLAEIMQIAPITYDYNGKGGIPAGPGGVSIIAQELQPIFPECIDSYRRKLEETDEEEVDILNYNGHAITFALINAIKELNAKVEALEAAQ
jgi:hypothetical protein